MVNIEDILLTFVIGGIMLTFIMSTYGGYSPVVSAIYNNYTANMTTLDNQTQTLTNQITNTAQSVSFDPSFENILASALGGITSSTITLAQILITSLLTLPIILIGIIFGMITAVITIVAPDYVPIFITLQSMFIVAVPLIILIGLFVRFMLGKNPEIY